MPERQLPLTPLVVAPVKMPAKGGLDYGFAKIFQGDLQLLNFWRGLRRVVDYFLEPREFLVEFDLILVVCFEVFFGRWNFGVLVLHGVLRTAWIFDENRCKRGPYPPGGWLALYSLAYLSPIRVASLGHDLSVFSTKRRTLVPCKRNNSQLYSPALASVR